VSGVGANVASVTASDGWTSASASVTSTGTNQTPAVTIHGGWTDGGRLCNGPGEAQFTVTDDDSQASGTCTARIQGSRGATCTLGAVNCGAGIVNFTVGPRPDTGPGVCALTVDFTDRWGTGGSQTVDSYICYP
jgi:hypothetical protein